MKEKEKQRVISKNERCRAELLSQMGSRWRIDDISAEILKSVPWEALQKIRNAFEMRYLAQNKEEIETWLRNTIVLFPKKKTMNMLEGQTTGICV